MSNEHQISDLLSLIKLDEYISFDLETTGLNPDIDRITEISACRFINGKFSEEFTSLINPGIPIPKNIILGNCYMPENDALLHFASFH